MRWSARKDAGSGGGLTSLRPRSPSCDVLDAMTHAPSSIGRIEFTRTVVGCSTNTSVKGHGQLADRHAETLDEEQDVLVHLRDAGSESDGVEDEGAGWEVDGAG